MTDQDAMLKLARAVYPESQWEIDGPQCVCRVDRHGFAVENFDPANNDSQAVSVLCWLLSPALSMAHPQKQFFTVTSWNIQRMRFTEDIDEPVLCWSVGIESSDPASFRAAVTKAALRVVG